MCHSLGGSICCTIWCFFGFVTCMLFGSFGFWNTNYYLVDNYGTGAGFSHNNVTNAVMYTTDMSKCAFPYNDEETCVKMKIGASFIAAGTNECIFRQVSGYHL